MSKLRLIQTYRESDNLVDWLQRLVGTIAEVENWREIGGTGNPVFEHSWANVGGADVKAAFYKDPYGVIHIKGRVDTGTLNTIIFTLPTGYIPSENRHFANMQTSAAVPIRVNILGEVSQVGAISNTNQSINCSFRV